MSLTSMSKWWHMYPGDHWNLQVSVPGGIQRLQLRRSVAAHTRQLTNNRQLFGCLFVCFSGRKNMMSNTGFILLWLNQVL